MATEINESNFLTEGENNIRMLHEYVSISKTLEQVKGDAEDKAAAYQKHLVVLEPAINKLRDLLAFYNKGLVFLVNYIEQAVKDYSSNGSLQEAKLDHLMKCIDLFLRLDFIKTWQAALNNDFSCYKRAVQHVRKDYSVEDDKDLWFFLVNPSNINKGLKDELEKPRLAGYENLLVELMNHATKAPFDPQSATDAIRIRICVFSVFLIDKQLADPVKIRTLRKTLKFSKFAKLFKDNPMVPIYADLKFDIPIFMKKCPNFNENSKKKEGPCLIL